MINILIVDDHQIILDGLKALLYGTEKEYKLSVALSGADAIRIAEEQAIDIILLDVNLPDISGFEVCKTIKTKKETIKIIALTMHGEVGYINKMIKSGADGYILKNAGKGEILQAIENVLKGERHFGKEVTDKLISGQRSSRSKSQGMIQKLTRRENEILKLITEELTTDEIAQRLFISSTTVISHRKSLLRKLNAKNTAGLVKAAYEFDLLRT